MTDKSTLARAVIFAKSGGDGVVETMKRHVKSSDVSPTDDLSLRVGELRGKVPAYGRVQVPLYARLRLRDAAESLEHLARQLRVLAGQSAIPEVTVLRRAHSAIRATDIELAERTPKDHYLPVKEQPEAEE